jgi:DNA-directed RNA polymerase specialized sigma24 family protein
VHLRRERTRHLALLLNSVDRFGRTVDPSILSVAQEIAPRAVPYGEKLLGDPALAITLFEEAAATLSRIIKEKAALSRPEIRDVRAYLFRTYLRRINVERRASVLLQDATREEGEKHGRQVGYSDLDRRILVKELLETCDTLTREIVYRKLEGYSGKEIQRLYGIPVNAANLRFSKALRRLKKILRSSGRSTRRSSDLASGK